jgi:hypothetical protein
LIFRDTGVDRKMPGHRGWNREAGRSDLAAWMGIPWAWK